jgi:hypothetical protein
MMERRAADAARRLAEDLSSPVFLATYEATSRPRVTFHLAKGNASRDVDRQTRAAFAKEGLGIRCRVARHRTDRLQRLASLEDLTARFGTGEIVYDPLGSMTRARALVAGAKTLREALGVRLAGLYLEPRYRTVYVVLDPNKFVRDGKLPVDRLAAAEDDVRETVRAVLDSVDEGLDLAVRIGFSLPGQSLVPIDRASAAPRRNMLSRMRSGAVPGVLAAVLGLNIAGASTAMADGPAVSAPNAKASANIGAISGEVAGAVEGSFAASPLADYSRFGVQADALLGGACGDANWGIGGHAFWRDPDQGLVGIIGSYSGLDGREAGRIGVEGEIYLGDFSVLARGGYLFGDSAVDSGGFGRLDLRWYATDDLAVTAGGEVVAGDGVGRGRVEYQPGFAGFEGLSVFADAGGGSNNYYEVLAGVRFYFGETKSLKDRHRKDNVESLLPGETFALTKDDAYGGSAAC